VTAPSTRDSRHGSRELDKGTTTFPCSEQEIQPLAMAQPGASSHLHPTLMQCLSMKYILLFIPGLVEGNIYRKIQQMFGDAFGRNLMVP